MSEHHEQAVSLERLGDELAIRDLIGRYVDAIHRRDREAWAGTWAEDARWVLPDVTDPDSELVMDGRATIVAGWVAAMQGYPFVAHMLHSGHIEWTTDDQPPGQTPKGRWPNGRWPEGRWYVSEVVEDQDGARHHFFGVYNDRYVKSAGQWLFAERVFSLLYMGPAAWDGTTFPHPQERGL